MLQSASRLAEPNRKPIRFSIQSNAMSFFRHAFTPALLAISGWSVSGFAQDASPSPATPVVTETVTEGVIQGSAAGAVGEATIESGTPEQIAENAAAEAKEAEKKSDSLQEEITDQAPSTATAETEMTGDKPAEKTGAIITEPSTPADADAAAPSGEVDIIPLPPDMADDASLLDLPTDSGPADASVLPGDSGDIPPLDIAPAMPSVPMGESARVLLARYKEVRIRIDKDPEVVALRAKADAAKTPEDSRAALREYYRMLFAKIRKADPTLTARADAMENAYLTRLSQNQIEPTIPLHKPEPPTPLPGSPVKYDAAASAPPPTPAAKPTPKPKTSPTPKPSPAPKASPTPRPAASPAASPKPKPAATPKSKAKATPTPAPTPTPEEKRGLRLWPFGGKKENAAAEAKPTPKPKATPKPTPQPR